MLSAFMSSLGSSSIPSRDRLNIWLISDTHTPTNNGKLQQACTDSKTEFDWDLALNGGDTFSEGQTGNTNGQLIVNEIENGLSGSSHTISDIYSIMGNHDDTGESESEGTNYYFQRWLDPLGLNPSTSKIINNDRPYPVNAGTYASYSIKVGNMLIIMLGDREDGPPPMGEDGLEADPDIWARRRVSGGIKQAEWDWFTNLVETNTDKIIIVISHHAIYETTLSSGLGEFWDAFNQTVGFTPPNGFGDATEAQYSGCLAYIENVLSVTTIDTWMQTYGQYIEFWGHGHYHRKIGETWNGRSRYEQKYGSHFFNISPINTIHHSTLAPLESKSNIISIQGDQLTIKTYIHEDQNGVFPKGFYNAEEVTYTMKTSLLR